jgi:hypothetical protein
MERTLQTFKVSQAELQELERLATTLQRNKSDAIRWAVREILRQVELEGKSANPTGRGGEHYASVELTS